MAMGGDFPSNFRGLLKQIQRRLSLLERAVDTKARQGQVDMLDKYVDQLLGGGGSGGRPGDIVWSAAGSRPGSLLADGSEVSRGDYPELFAAIGTTYGQGDGSSTFNLPDIRGRAPVGRDQSDPDFSSLGTVGGEKEHSLTESEMPAHDHGFTSQTSSESHNHSFSGTTSSNSHNHGIGGAGRFVTTDRPGDLANRTAPTSTTGAAFVPAYSMYETVGSASNTANASHSHTISGTTGSKSHSHSVEGVTDIAGAGGAHNNLQPYLTLNPFILT